MVLDSIIAGIAIIGFLIWIFIRGIARHPDHILVACPRCRMMIPESSQFERGSGIPDVHSCLPAPTLDMNKILDESHTLLCMCDECETRRWRNQGRE